MKLAPELHKNEIEYNSIDILSGLLKTCSTYSKNKEIELSLAFVLICNKTKAMKLSHLILQAVQLTCLDQMVNNLISTELIKAPVGKSTLCATSEHNPLSDMPAGEEIAELVKSG